jgi:anhydro-N-acetylmuramic acid kinase
LEFKESGIVLGLMSGTSLDGLDIAACRFKSAGLGKLDFEIVAASSIPYDQYLRSALEQAFYLSPKELEELSYSYAAFIAEQIKDFCKNHEILPDLISSHGHTVHHRPSDKVSLQIGDGRTIREITGIPTVCNFRIQDVLKGGQGAPLVPIGDELLFSAFDYCLNLGGFANISWKSEDRRLACDIAPCNMVLNKLANRLDFAYDDHGNLASGGMVQDQLLAEWNQLEYYHLPFPKSLGREWFLESFEPILNKYNLDTKDLLRTATEHISDQLANFIRKIETGTQAKILLTGGGTYNDFLIKRLSQKLPGHFELVVPSEVIIDFKEALIFALLGYLRKLGMVNTLSSVTGAYEDHCSGEYFS